MPDTYTQIVNQFVFAVEGRQSLSASTHQEDVNKYITGIVRAEAQHPTNIRLRWSRSEGGGSRYKHAAPLGQGTNAQHPTNIRLRWSRPGGGSRYKHAAPLGQVSEKLSATRGAREPREIFKLQSSRLAIESPIQ